MLATAARMILQGWRSTRGQMLDLVHDGLEFVQPIANIQHLAL